MTRPSTEPARRFRWAAALCILTALLLAGCRTNPDQARREHAGEFADALQARTAAALPEGEALGLDDCVRIALKNNLSLRAAEIDQRIASLDRKVAFANFLPTVEYGFNRRGTEHVQMVNANGNYMQTSDQHIATQTISIQQSIFVPETWFLYAARRNGEDISRRILTRARQQITLQVTALYYACLSLDGSAAASHAAVEQAEATLTEIGALGREGLATDAQIRQAEVLVLARRTALENLGRAQRQARSELLDALGVSPLAVLTLKASPSADVDARPVEDLVLEAMLHRPELHAADSAVAIQKDMTRMAIAAFLPRLVVGANLQHSSDSYLRYADLWSYGVSGVVSVFDGFRNIGEYRAARARKEQAMAERERACLTIMLEVLTARLRADEAESAFNVARLARAAAEQTLKEAESRWREGLLQSSERLDVLTRMEQAQAQYAIAQYQLQVAAATLQNVIGKTGTES